MAAIFLAGVLIPVKLNAGQWASSQFSSAAPVLFYNANSTLPPTIPGLTWSPYPNDVTELTPSTLTDYYGLAPEALENDSFASGYSYLDITFNPPQQAVGGYPFSLDGDNIGSVTEIVYDRNTNVIESASITVPQYIFGPPGFLGIGETNAAIYKVEWRYATGGFFGVGSIIYQPGALLVLSNLTSTATNLTFKFQSISGRTNMVQTSVDLAAGTWTTLTNLTLFGDGTFKTINVPITNGAAQYFRVQVP